MGGVRKRHTLFSRALGARRGDRNAIALHGLVVGLVEEVDERVTDRWCSAESWGSGTRLDWFDDA